MKRTLSVLTAVLFAGAIAAPVMAQSAPTAQNSEVKVAQAAGGMAEKPAEAPAAEATAKPKHKHHGMHHGHKKPKGEASPAAAASPAAGAEH